MRGKIAIVRMVGLTFAIFSIIITLGAVEFAEAASANGDTLKVGMLMSVTGFFSVREVPGCQSNSNCGGYYQ